MTNRAGITSTPGWKRSMKTLVGFSFVLLMLMVALQMLLMAAPK